METRANYIIVGLFVLLLALSGLGFVVWIAKIQIDQEFAHYDIVFEDAVTGVKEGSPVRYKGVGVGEVLFVDLDPTEPTRIRVRIEVQKRTPVRADTKATLELEGLTGGRYVQLTGGSPDAQPIPMDQGWEVPEIPSESSSFEQLLEGAPEVINNANALLVKVQRLFSNKNLASVETTLTNIADITQTVSENRAKIGPIIDDTAVMMSNLRSASEDLQPLIATLDREVTLTAEEARGLIANLNATAKRITAATTQAEEMLAENRPAIRDFTNSGLYELTSLLIEGRELVAVLTRVGSEIERDPARFLFGDQQQGYEAQQ